MMNPASRKTAHRERVSYSLYNTDQESTLQQMLGGLYKTLGRTTPLPIFTSIYMAIQLVALSLFLSLSFTFLHLLFLICFHKQAPFIRRGGQAARLRLAPIQSSQSLMAVLLISSAGQYTIRHVTMWPVSLSTRSMTRFGVIFKTRRRKIFQIPSVGNDSWWWILAICPIFFCMYM